MTFELQLQRIRKRAGYNQQEMSDLLGVKKRTYGSWEREEVMMSLEQAYNVTEVLDCTLDELVGRQPPKPGSYADANQQRLNNYYESLNEKSKDDLVGFVRSFAADPARRMVKDRQDIDDQTESIA